jgi:hypothetical protein
MYFVHLSEDGALIVSMISKSIRKNGTKENLRAVVIMLTETKKIKQQHDYIVGSYSTL